LRAKATRLNAGQCWELRISRSAFIAAAEFVITIRGVDEMARGTAEELESYSVKELRELKGRIDSMIVTKEKTEKVELRAKMIALAEEAGLSLDDVLGNVRGRASKSAVAIKYRDPENPQNTWTGRGRTPLWLVEKLKKRGVGKEDFAI
jgi:DNA-binding protein H-NS